MSFRLIDKMLLMNVFYLLLFGGIFALAAPSAQGLEFGIRKLEERPRPALHVLGGILFGGIQHLL